jgi:ribose transport system substrate-binding protein
LNVGGATTRHGDAHTRSKAAIRVNPEDHTQKRKQRENVMPIARTKSAALQFAAASALSAGAFALALSSASAAPLVKDCSKTGKFVIGFSQANNAEPYRQHVNDDLTASAKKVPQFELQIADGAGNVNTQTSQMDNFITQKVDLILISPFEAAPLTPVVARAMKAGIPVIELDRKTLGDPGKDYTAFIGGDNFKIAEEAGHYVADKLLPGGGEVAVLEGLPSSTPAVERLNGFKAGVKDNGKIQIVAEQAADWLPDKAQTAFAAMLQAHPDIKAVYASNDMMAAGARLAAKGAGKKDGDIKILGTDGLPGPAGGIRAVAEGEWAATFTYPTGAPEAIDMAKSILLDCADKVPSVVTVATQAITPANAKSLMGN